MNTQAMNKINQMNTEQMCEAFDMTERMEGDNVPVIRGWLMDALEARNPAAFEAWMDSAEDSPLRFFA